MLVPSPDCHQRRPDQCQYRHNVHRSDEPRAHRPDKRYRSGFQHPAAANSWGPRQTAAMEAPAVLKSCTSLMHYLDSVEDIPEHARGDQQCVVIGGPRLGKIRI